MPATNLSYLDYLKAAFQRRWNVPGLGSLPLNYLGLAAFAVLSLANPGFLFLGTAAELAYLFTLSSSQRFQKLIQGETLLDAKETWEATLQEAVGRLSPQSQVRYHQLLNQCRHILGIGEALGENKFGGLQEMRAGGLNQMLWIFLRLLSSREVLEDNLSRVNRVTLEKEVEYLEKRLATTPEESALARSLSGTLDIQRKRLDNLQRAKESMEVIDAELQRIQHQVVLIREESAVSGKAEILSSRLDAVSGALDETNRWMEQNASIFGELGADPLATPPRDLPGFSRSVERES